MTTVLDRDCRTVSTRLPFDALWYAQPRAEPGDPGLATEADQVQARDPRHRAYAIGDLAGELEAFRLRVGRPLAALDHLGRNGDPRDVLVDVAQRFRRADKADRRDQRDLVSELLGDGLGQEALEQVELEAHLQLEKACARANLLERAIDAIVERRRARILDGAD